MIKGVSLAWRAADLNQMSVPGPISPWHTTRISGFKTSNTFESRQKAAPAASRRFRGPPGTLLIAVAKACDGSRNDLIWQLANFPSTNDFVTSWAHSMKRSTTGLRVRFFSVTIATCIGGRVRLMHNMRGDARVVGMQQQIIDQMRAELKTLPEVDEDAEV